MKTLNDLLEASEKHPYYCSDTSYYGLKFETSYKTWGEFVSEMGNADLDMNLVFRWDVKKSDDGAYYMEVFIVHQRKGRFVPFQIDLITEQDVPSIVEYLTIRKDHLLKLWEA